jgi:hypothetical protein
MEDEEVDKEELATLRKEQDKLKKGGVTDKK